MGNSIELSNINTSESNNEEAGMMTKFYGLRQNYGKDKDYVDEGLEDISRIMRNRKCMKTRHEDSQIKSGDKSNEIQSNKFTVKAEICSEIVVAEIPFKDYPSLDVFEIDMKDHSEEKNKDICIDELSNHGDGYEESILIENAIIDEAENEEQQKRIMAKNQYLVGVTWSLSAIYSVLTKDDGGNCNIREDPEEKFQLISIFISLILPLIVGPFLSFVLFTCSKLILKKSLKQDESKNKFYLIHILTFIFALFYFSNLIISELLFDHLSIFSFVILKHISSSLLSMMFPFFVLSTKKDVAEEAKIVFRSKSSVQASNGEMTLQQIRKHVLAGAGEI